MMRHGDDTEHIVHLPTTGKAITAVMEALRSELRLGDHLLEPGDQVDLLPGADSVRLVRVLALLERQFDVELEDEAVRSADTIGEIASLLTQACEGKAR